MFRVPIDAERPTFDQVTKVSFWRWLTSSKKDRLEWFRRRNEAAKLAQRNQEQRIRDWDARQRQL